MTVSLILELRMIIGRWFAAILDISPSSIHLAVSASVDPEGNWTDYSSPYMVFLGMSAWYFLSPISACKVTY